MEVMGWDERVSTGRSGLWPNGGLRTSSGLKLADEYNQGLGGVFPPLPLYMLLPDT